MRLSWPALAAVLMFACARNETDASGGGTTNGSDGGDTVPEGMTGTTTSGVATTTVTAGGSTNDATGTTTSDTTPTGSTTGSRPQPCSEFEDHQGDLVIDDSVVADDVRCIRSVQGVLRVSGTTGWTDLAPLANLETSGGLAVVNNAALVTLEGLQGLQRVLGGIYINDNPQLQSISALASVSHLRDLVVSRNPSLLSVESLSGSPTFESEGAAPGDLVIQDNDALVDLDGFLALAAWSFPPGAQLIIIENGNLADISGIAHLVGGDMPGTRFDLRENPKLTSVAALSGITGLQDLLLTGTALESLDGLESLSYVEGDLSFSGSTGITDLSVLADLESVGNELVIGSCSERTPQPNTALVSLDGLEGLWFVGYGLGVFGNPELLDISALQTLADGGGDFGVSFRMNPQLPLDDITAFLERAGKDTSMLPEQICMNGGQPVEPSCPCDFPVRGESIAAPAQGGEG